MLSVAFFNVILSVVVLNVVILSALGARAQEPNAIKLFMVVIS
jgi:hypothetical protein